MFHWMLSYDYGLVGACAAQSLALLGILVHKKCSYCIVFGLAISIAQKVFF